ncbi:ATP-binding protein [Cellulomonas sp. NS3]|uniref:ATP-binding protein n=1 Tax=Cellulomonas sp. NS3 TaxID=2973977 RepID=UPI00216342A6|nr:ATP-binding protein [Cellulomonas sp. NS3]
MEHVARAELSLVTRARRRVADHATRCGASAEQSLDIELLASEIVTIAVVHGAPAGQVRIATDHTNGTFTVSVSNQSRREVGHPRPADPAGRSLWMVESLAASWGITADPDGKVLWFSVELDPCHERLARRLTADPPHSRRPGAEHWLNSVPQQRCP